MKKRRGFTLSELLVVVVIIGVLSAVVLPKFSKVIETRKTTEAEELMSAVRTEQEARCTLSKKYADVSTLGSYRAGKNFSYGNENKNLGMIATANNNKYKLEMPSYADGRICCSDIETGACSNLNKSYPLCSELKGYSDYKEASEDCGIEIEEGKETPTTPEEPECVSGTTEEKTCSNNCGETGTQKNQCIGGKWQGWGACSVSDKTSCGGDNKCDPNAKPDTERDCGCGYKQTRAIKCDVSTNYQWEIQVGSNLSGTGASTDADGWSGCGKPRNGTTKKEECLNIQVGTHPQTGSAMYQTAYNILTWSDESCSWEPADDCCEKHDSYSEDCPNGQSGKIWYSFNYNTCKYEKSSETCGNGVWGPSERIDTYVSYTGACFSADIPFYAGASNGINTDQKYKQLLTDVEGLYGTCPSGASEGNAVPASFTGSMCYVKGSFTKQGKACMPYSVIQPECINGRFMSGGHEVIAGPYTTQMSNTQISCTQSGSFDCPDQIIDNQQICVLPYAYYIRRVIK